VESMQPTRWEILQILKKRSRATVDELASALGMTLMAIRLHLIVLERDGLVSRSSIRERPGRPTLVYTLTENAEDVFPKSYELLATRLLEEFQNRCGHGGMESAYRAVAASFAAPYLAVVQGRSTRQRVEAATSALNERLCFAEWESHDEEFLLHIYNCPFYRVAMKHRHVCQLDQHFLEELVGVCPERRASLLDKQGRCTFAVPAREQGA